MSEPARTVALALPHRPPRHRAAAAPDEREDQVKTKAKNYYMHLLGSRPASYDGSQVHFLAGTCSAKLCSSLREIRKQQRASAAWRTAQGWPASAQDHGYGYCLVRLP
jgi:hypothetical protein